jgi:hypothetical protein
MADLSDSEQEVGVVARKGRLYRKRNSEKENHQKMLQYYADPEKRVKLKERIKNYNETIQALQDKVKKLSIYLNAYETPEEMRPGSG